MKRILFNSILLLSLVLGSMCGVAQENQEVTNQEVISVTATPKSTEIQKEFKPKSLLETVNQQKTVVQRHLEEVQSGLEVVSATATPEMKEFYNQQIGYLNSIIGLLDQQTAELQRASEFIEQNERMRSEIEKQESQDFSETSFIEWDRVRDELHVESNQKEVVDTKVESAKSNLEKIKSTRKDRESKVNEWKKRIEAEDKEFSPEKRQQELLISQLALREAAEQVRLQEFVLENRRLEKQIYEARLDLLQKRMELMQPHVTFTRENLDQQVQRLEKEEFELNQQLKKRNEELEAVKRRLTLRRTELSQATEPSKALEEEVKALQLESEALQNTIELLERKIELIPVRTNLWQRRYSIFNFSIDMNDLSRWKSESNEKIDELNQDYRILQLRLDGRKNELLIHNNRLEAASEEPKNVQTQYQLQQNHLQSIVNSIQEQQNVIEVTRRLLNKVIEEINQRTQRLTWQERADAIMKMEYYGNTVLQWAWAVGVMLIFLVLSILLRWYLVRRLRRYASKSHEQMTLAAGILECVQRTKLLFILILGIFIACQMLEVAYTPKSIIVNVTKVALVIQGAIWVSFIIRVWIFKYLLRKTKRDSTSLGAMSIFNFISQLLVWAIALMLTLDNLGVDVTTLIAGLGIGGIAVALALQNILGDLFSSLSIVLDKPFVVGDFVIFDNFNYLGTIEHIGIKTTRIRSLTGEQIVCSNSYMLSANVRNFKRMNERRVAFKVGVIYQTPKEKLEKIPEKIREIIESIDQTRFDRSHFQAFGDFSLNFETVYFVLVPDYVTYMDIQQEINLRIYEFFEEEGIKFAYPTQMIYHQAVQDQNEPQTLP